MTGSDRSLAAELAVERTASLIRQATIVRDWPDGPERAEQAKSLIRAALVEWAMGRISQETESQLYSILAFAMPDEPAHQDEPRPLAELEREAEWEAAYHEQLEQRSCPECGDGLCPNPANESSSS